MSWTVFDERGRKKLTGQRGRDGDAANAAHLADATAAHAASAISLADVNNRYAATDVEAALEEVFLRQSPASAVSLADTGGYYKATDVEAALKEVLGKQWAYYEEFIYGIGGPPGSGPFGHVVGNSGTGATIVISTAGGKSQGVLSLSGSAATDTAGIVGAQIYTVTQNNSASLRYRAGAVCSLSTPTNRFTIRVGLMNSYSGDPAYGVFFRYVDNVNSGNWVFVCRNNGVESTTSSNRAPASNTNQVLEFITTPTSITPLIDGAAEGMSAITTNLPNAVLGSAAHVTWSAANANTNALLLDYVRIDILEPNGGRTLD